MQGGLSSEFLGGVIEGFYGQPWSQTERLQLFEQMGEWRFNTYLYAPKDDLKHRALWRELYTTGESEKLSELIRACGKHKIQFIYALSPGLDIRYGNESDLDLIRQRFQQMQSLGCEHFALLFDDIPDRLDREDITRWGSLAGAQCHAANKLFGWARQCSPRATFLFCPTAYCGRMARNNLGGEGYLQTLGSNLSQGIHVFWTGPEIVSREIPLAHVEQVTSMLRRKPLLWDNLHANDYDGRRFFCGPFSGRPPELIDAVSGLLSNPNNEFPLNFVPLRTLAEFLRCGGAWDPRKAYLSAMREWLPRFASVGQPVTFEELVLLGDCYYLPHEEGAEAEELCRKVRSLLDSQPAAWGNDAQVFRQKASRLRSACMRMAELRHRPLFYALSRRIWELREEIDLLERYFEHKSRTGDALASCPSDFHLAGTYRGGMVARLQRMLVQRADGSFEPSEAQ
jgi:protein O-GlcNAcase / histone acetyltransferase